MISQDELADIFANVLIEPVLEFAGLMYLAYKAQHKSHRKLYRKEDEYADALYQYYQKEVRAITKLTGSSDFNLRYFLSDAIKKQNFSRLIEKGGLQFEHDKIRTLLSWYHQKLEVKYKRYYQIGSDDFGDLEIIAWVKKKNTKEEVRLKFDYFKDTLALAGKILAKEKLIEEIAKEVDSFHEGQAVGTSTGKKKATKQNTSNRERQDTKLVWNGDTEILVKIFNRLRTKIHTGYNCIVMPTTEENQLCLITACFVDATGKPLTARNNKTKTSGQVFKPITWNGSDKAFTKLLYYLTLLPVPENGKKYLEADNKAIAMFISNNFYKKIESGERKEITPANIERYTREFPRSLATLTEEDGTNKAAKVSIITFLQDLLQ